METLRMSLAELPGTVVATTGTSLTERLPVKSESQALKFYKHCMRLEKRLQYTRTSDVRLGASQQPFPDEEHINPEDVHQ